MANLIYAIGMVTLVGVPKTEYPLSWGNCFSARLTAEKSGQYADIVNFDYENLKELLRRGTLTWPIEIVYLDEARKIALVRDPRIPAEWYRTKYCEVCTPRDLLNKP